MNVGSGGGAAAPAAGGAAAGGDAPAEAAKEEEKEEGRFSCDPLYQFTVANNPIAKEESDEDMGFGLFD